MRHHPSLALIVCSCLFACSAPEPDVDLPLELPSGVSVRTWRYAGTGLSGPQAATVEIDADPVRVSLIGYQLEYSPENELDFLGEQATFVAEPGRESPVRVASLLTTKTRIGHGDQANEIRRAIEEGEAGRFQLLFDRDLPLSMGTTAAVGGRSTELMMRAPTSWDRDPEVGLFDQAISLHISRVPDSESLELLLVREGPLQALAYDPDAEEVAEEEPARSISINERMARLPAPVEEMPGHEIIGLRDPLSSRGEPMVILMVSPFDRLQDRAIALFLEAHTDGGPLSEEERAELRAELDESAGTTEKRSRRVDRELARNNVLLDALRGPLDERERRRVLLLLADRVSAPLSTDFAMVSDDATFAEWRKLLRKAAADLGDATDEAIAWLLERNAYGLLADRMSRGEIPPELSSLLLRHLGEVGRYPTTIEELLASHTTLTSFEEEVEAMNTLFLEDTGPAARVRAFDWLAQRGGTPPGFDPLAPLEERREALQRLEEAAMEAELEKETP